jgi:hypothetical protein
MGLTPGKMELMAAYGTFCPTTHDHFKIDPGPSDEQYEARFWTYVCPSCGEQHRQRLRPKPIGERPEPRRTIDIPLDLDLGEIVEGQHVVVKGIELGRPWGSVLHNDFVPGFDTHDRNTNVTWGLGEVSDDVGTTYDHGGQGGWGPNPKDDLVHWGDEHLGNSIPGDATFVTIEVHHAYEWTPPDRWIRKFTVDLGTGAVIDLIEG